MISASCDPLPTPFHVWLQKYISYIFWSSCAKLVRLVHCLFLLSNVGRFISHHPYRGCSILCIGFATHPCRENMPVFFMLNHGNWLHNSFPLTVTHWKWRDFLTWCGCVHSMRLHMRCICLICMLHAPWCAGGQGPCGGCALVYTNFYTDQEKWSVNHITYIVVYTEQCSQKRVL